ncbi:MAG: bifunctional DNA-formamidopyrimidine glycosylase/DNA-(apurinic or apyrimidinic site) lyase [Gammaproteobacteria bacterium]|nr:bifunctional DNA-formamidopyrimidine glycosylase/DNA-(apurinic or apyrimidinic site) lyase [Gammaproteobacteria bacterium]MCW8988373.1 bifunctional DNA-formamidopyrimidine glycosylase/DNA-(apurinic or apyrimidinic site) lyase [Gammaproteobacteria bacterium]MCW9030177.1 bifunctional DNA-formamidopyrimidine glycosylase/DNA-(apurinic or apyrimidinic site) lyase [Gammaproteobacteria bacterium]
MPELPEVETTCRGIAPHIEDNTITHVIVRNRSLRWPVPTALHAKLKDQVVRSVTRRAKYLLLNTDAGTLIIHLGMSGSLRILAIDEIVDKHDHFEIQFKDGYCLRLRDPRRFGAVLWTKEDPLQHKLLINLGPEPLDKKFTADLLFEKSRKRKTSIKQFIMDAKIVVGVGNIYASESLFLAGINPKKAAGKITKAQSQDLVKAIKKILTAAIKQGGTTLKDFKSSDGKPGYFQQKLKVYDRKGSDCLKCNSPIKQITLGQRSTFYCSSCQK